MNKKIFNVSVSMQDNYNKVVRGVILNDTGNLLNMILLDDGAPFDYSGYTMIKVQIVRPDGTMYVDGIGQNLNAVDPKDGLVSYALPVSTVNISGMYYVVITVYGDGHAVSTFHLNYFIEGTAVTNDDDVQNQDQYPVLDKMLTKLSDIDENETLRAEQEENRKEAEADRVQAETKREQAESARADAESKRVSAENGRATAENGRVNAENARETAMDNFNKKMSELEVNQQDIKKYYDYIKVNIGDVDVAKETSIYAYGKRLTGVTVRPAAWVSDSSNASYPYRCDIPAKDVSDSLWKVTDVFCEDPAVENFDPVCNTADGKVQFWSKSVPDHAVAFWSIDIMNMEQQTGE